MRCVDDLRTGVQLPSPPPPWLTSTFSLNRPPQDPEVERAYPRPQGHRRARRRSAPARASAASDASGGCAAPASSSHPRPVRSASWRPDRLSGRPVGSAGAGVAIGLTTGTNQINLAGQVSFCPALHEPRNHSSNFPRPTYIRLPLSALYHSVNGQS
jgi:hypothetical protein